MGTGMTDSFRWARVGVFQSPAAGLPGIPTKRLGPKRVGFPVPADRELPSACGLMPAPKSIKALSP